MIQFLLSDITLDHYLLLSILLFFSGVLGVALQRNIIGIVMSLEVMLLSSCLSFISSSCFNGGLDGQIFSLFILAVGAAEIALALMIFLIYYKISDDVNIKSIQRLKD